MSLGQYPCSYMFLVTLYAAAFTVRSARVKNGRMRFDLKSSKSQHDCPCLDLSQSGRSLTVASNYTTRFKFRRGYEAPEDADPQFVNQSLYHISLPSLHPVWKQQQEICVGPDRPVALDTQGRARNPWAHREASNKGEIPSSAEGFLNFIHGGLKQTSSGPMPSMMTYLIAADAGEDGNGYLAMAEEGDHMADALRKDFPYLRKYDGRHDTKHTELTSGGLLYAGEIFVDLGSEWKVREYDWEAIESGNIVKLFPNAVVVIDDGSGTYTPSALNLPTAACILEAYFPGLRVMPQSYLEVSKSPQAMNMNFQFAPGNAIKPNQQRQIKRVQEDFQQPYTMEWQVIVAPVSQISEFVQLNLRKSKFPSAWGAVREATVKTDTKEFRVHTDKFTLDGQYKDKTIIWSVADDETLTTTWHHVSFRKRETSPEVQSHVVRGG